MNDKAASGPEGQPYFADRAEHLIGQIVGVQDASAGHPAATDNNGLIARIASLEDRLADVERRLTDYERLWADRPDAGRAEP